MKIIVKNLKMIFVIENNNEYKNWTKNQLINWLDYLQKEKEIN
mgnify:CR=1 FL=1